MLSTPVGHLQCSFNMFDAPIVFILASIFFLCSLSLLFLLGWVLMNLSNLK
jgi:hypothetical protein